MAGTEEGVKEAGTVWNQSTTPVAFRTAKNLYARMPPKLGALGWLHRPGKRKPLWCRNKMCWRIPVSWLDWFIETAIEKNGACFVIREIKKREQCAPACWNAKGADCQCSCMGANHGQNEPGGKWHVLSDAYAVHFGPKTYAVRRYGKTNP